MQITAQSEIGLIKTLLLKHPKDSFRNQEYIDANWHQLNYLAPPEFNKAVEEYEQFVEILDSFDIELEFLPYSDDAGMDSIYVRDASIVTDEGLILCNMGKGQRISEPLHQMEHYLKSNQKILGSCQAPATIEGGDVAWITDKILAVAEGYRTNAAGIAMLKSLTSNCCEIVIQMDSPHYKGADDVFHLMSVFSPVSTNLAVVYSPLMSVPFRNYLVNLGFQFIEVTDGEFATLGCNVLAITPDTCLLVKGNPKTRESLIAAGKEVIEFSGAEICLKGSGGPTCLTRPLLREL